MLYKEPYRSEPPLPQALRPNKPPACLRCGLAPSQASGHSCQDGYMYHIWFEHDPKSYMKEIIGRWKDVPGKERMTEEDLRNCEGAQDADWLASSLAILESPSCQRAVHNLYWRKYLPCRNQVAKGERYCPRHGGNLITVKREPRKVCRFARFRLGPIKLFQCRKVHRGSILCPRHRIFLGERAEQGASNILTNQKLRDKYLVKRTW